MGFLNVPWPCFGVVKTLEIASKVAVSLKSDKKQQETRSVLFCCFTDPFNSISAIENVPVEGLADNIISQIKYSIVYPLKYFGIILFRDQGSTDTLWGGAMGAHLCDSVDSDQTHIVE